MKRTNYLLFMSMLFLLPTACTSEKESVRPTRGAPETIAPKPARNGGRSYFLKEAIIHNEKKTISIGLEVFERIKKEHKTDITLRSGESRMIYGLRFRCLKNGAIEVTYRTETECREHRFDEPGSYFVAVFSKNNLWTCGKVLIPFEGIIHHR